MIAKQIPLNKIPKDWKVVRLGDAIKFIKGKKPNEMTEEHGDYLPYLSTEYLRENKPTKFVKNLKDTILVNDGDLILLWDGSNAGEFFLGKRGVLSSTMVKIQLKRKDYDRRFLFYLLKMKENYLKEQTKGTGIPHVDEAVLSNLIIPLPPLSEQQKIVEILSTVDKKLELERKRKEKLERIKKGLMNDLLTGKKRVKIK
ncbi:MAG: restriction endonuclease subunit S [Candidatus Aenigmatarchaeota archaeon]